MPAMFLRAAEPRNCASALLAGLPRSTAPEKMPLISVTESLERGLIRLLSCPACCEEHDAEPWLPPSPRRDRHLHTSSSWTVNIPYSSQMLRLVRPQIYPPWPTIACLGSCLSADVFLQRGDCCNRGCTREANEVPRVERCPLTTVGVPFVGNMS